FAPPARCRGSAGSAPGLLAPARAGSVWSRSGRRPAPARRGSAMPRQPRAGRQDAGKPGQANTPSVEAESDGGEPNHLPAGSKRPAPGLHVVATPIGNAEDITLRALMVLRGADAIACEDTRVTAKLLARHGIATPLLAYHDHNAARMRPLLLERLRRGAAIALVSDAGTPLVSDPGFKLVREV